MDNSLMELLNEITLYDLIIALILIVILVILVISQRKKISNLLNKWRKDKNEEEDFTKLVYELKDSIKKLSEELHKHEEGYNNLRKEVYEQSKEIKSLTQAYNEMKEKEAKTKRAELKEKIEKIYRECHPNMKCTDMQLEVLKDLIEEYEEHGGLNSFVHSTVEPEMLEWEIIKRIKG